MRTVLLWIALISSVCFSSVQAQTAPLRVDIEPGDADGVVRFSIINTSDESVSVLRWDTPLENTLSSDVFRLERRLKQWPLIEHAPYIGRDVKRAVPGPEHFLTLAAGETVSREIALHEHYQLSEADQWHVRFKGLIRYERLPEARQGLRMRSMSELSDLTVTAHESNRVALRVVPVDLYRARTPAFNNCSAQQQSDIVAAAELAEEYLGIAVGDLQSLSIEQRATSPRYVTWFGAYDASRFDRVSSNFRTMATVLENEEIRFDCGCDEAGVFAYVIPVRPFDIFLCPAFRSASIGGTDSRAGTIIHELTHFNVIAGTDDHVYSQRGAQSLARTDPATAITNADSYEYFAENTPALEISSNTTTSVSTEFSVLTLNTSVSGSVEQGRSVIYEVSNASRISLSSNAGDADLYVYSDTALAAETCRSIATTSEDICEIFVDGPIYVRVYGYSTATYTLEATGPRSQLTPAASATPLVPGTTAFGSLQEDERVVYRVSGARQVELESLTGDADLYVFQSLDFVASTLVCSSKAYSSDSTLDQCALPSPSETYYLLVVGYQASDYSLAAIEAGPLSESQLPTDDDPATLTQQVSSPFTPVLTSGGGAGLFGGWGIGFLVLFNTFWRTVGTRRRC